MHLPATLCNQVPSAVIWDGSEQGLIFAAHHLPARGAGLVACLNRPTRLYHLPFFETNTLLGKETKNQRERIHTPNCPAAKNTLNLDPDLLGPKHYCPPKDGLGPYHDDDDARRRRRRLPPPLLGRRPCYPRPSLLRPKHYCPPKDGLGHYHQ